MQLRASYACSLRPPQILIFNLGKDNKMRVWMGTVKSGQMGQTRVLYCHVNRTYTRRPRNHQDVFLLTCGDWTGTGWGEHPPGIFRRLNYTLAHSGVLHVIYCPFFTTIRRLRFTLADSTRSSRNAFSGSTPLRLTYTPVTRLRLTRFHGESLGYRHMSRHS